ncbi:MAG: outer membrane beta-barrel protein, partial [Desulfobacterota bacterium]|nr:outer membrane beta-barrel protein [Thermodesulfobacteriota bacterium]
SHIPPAPNGKHRRGLLNPQPNAELRPPTPHLDHTTRFARFLTPKIYAEIEPIFSWQLYYEDNVYATANDHVEDFSNRYLPKIKLNIKTDRMSLKGEGLLNIIEYVDERDYNTVDQDYTMELSYLLNKRLTILIGGAYSVNTDPNRYFQLEPDDIGSLALVGTYVVKKYKTKTKTATGSCQYMFSPRDLLTGMIVYSSFDTGVTDSSDFYMGVLQYQNDLSRKIKFNLTSSYNYMRFKFGGKAEEGDIDFLEDLVSGGDYDVFFGSAFKSKMYSTTTGLAYMFGEGSSINASCGWIHNVQNITTETENPETGEMITETRRPDGNTLTYDVGYVHSFSTTAIKMGLKQNAGDNANTGASYRSRDLEFRITHDIDRRLACNLILKYYRYHSDKNDFGFEIKRHILYIMGGITYYASRWLNISLTYQYSNNNNKNIGRKVERNSVFASLTFQPLRPFVFR